MILAALKQKLRARGPAGFAADATVLALSYVVSAPFVALEWLKRPRGAGSDIPSSTDDFATGGTSCRNAEEPES